MLNGEGGPTGPPNDFVRKLAHILSPQNYNLILSFSKGTCQEIPVNVIKHLEEELYGIRNKFIDDVEVQQEISQCFFNIRKYTNKISEYDISAFPPFLAVIQGERSLHPMNVGKYLFENKIEGIKKIESKGRNRMGIYFNTPEQANSFVNNKEILNKNWVITIPPRMITCRGVVWNMGDDIYEEDIINYGLGIRGNSRIKILNARRIYKRSRNEDNTMTRKRTNSFIITFKGNQVPLDLELFNVLREIHTYKIPVIICHNCYRFGHRILQCRSRKRCIKCSDTHEDDDRCSLNQLEIKCINCKENHYPTNKECKEFKRQFMINDAMAKHNISFFEANKLFPKEHVSSPDSQHFPETLVNLSVPRSVKKHHYISTLKKSRPRSPVSQRIQTKISYKDILFPDSARLSSSPILNNLSQSENKSKIDENIDASMEVGESSNFSLESSSQNTVQSQESFVDSSSLRKLINDTNVKTKDKHITKKSKRAI